MGDDSLDMEQIALLDADSIPNENQSYNCFSCGEDMTGVFCYACGNKNDNYRRSVWTLGFELFASLTALEGRTWRSLKSLIFKPGEMARSFADGARIKWTSPVRMYLAMSLLLFGYVALSQTQLIAFAPKAATTDVFEVSTESTNFTPKLYFLARKSYIRSQISEEDLAKMEDEFQSIIRNDSEKSDEELNLELERTSTALADLEARIENPPSPYAVPGLKAGRDAVAKRIAQVEAELESRKDTAERDDGEVQEKRTPAEEFMEGFKDGATARDKAKAGEESSDPAEKTNNEKEDSNGSSSINITDGAGNEFTLDPEGLREAASIAMRNPERVNAPVNRWLPRIMFIMMPFSMLMGAIFIRGREKAMLYDHLVHAAYIHAFSFLLLFVFILLTQYTPIPGLLWIYTAILLVYLPLSAKKMFGRSWFKTFLTSYGVGAFYTFIMLIILSLLIISGLVDIAKDVSQARAA